MIDAGKYRHTIRIEVRTSTQDSVGEQHDTWTTYATTRAKMEAGPAGSEEFASAERQGLIPTVWRIRYRAGITPAMRVVFGIRVFDIRGVVDPNGRKEELLLTTEERVDETAGPDGGPYVPPIQTIAASNVIVTPAGNLASTSGQAALEELQTDIDTRATTTALNNHTGATSGAHAASAISVVPTGNLASTQVQAALEELQTDVDGRATSGHTHTAFGALTNTGKLTFSGIPSGQNAIEMAQGNRVQLGGSAARYLHDDGTRIRSSGPFWVDGLATFAADMDCASWVQASGAVYIAVRGKSANSGTAIGVVLDNSNALSTSGAKLVSMRNGGVEKAFVDKDGQLECTVAGMGIILRSPNGTRYRITVTDAGALAVAPA